MSCKKLRNLDKANQLFTDKTFLTDSSMKVLKEILKQTIKQAGINFYQCCLYY